LGDGRMKLKALHGITRFLEYANWIALAFLSLLVVYQVVTRYILNDPSSWSEELARIVFIYMTFLGAALAIKRGRSLRITVFIEHLPKKLRFISYNLINGTITIVFLIYSIYYSYWLIQKLSASHTPSLELPISFVYLSVPIGCLLMVVYYLEEFTQKK
jgi:TRAP-type C4-dicarboxylate transport system permease small subunit